MKGANDRNPLAKTNLFFLEEDLTALFGCDEGARLFALTETIYADLCACGDDRNNAAIRMHLTTNLFPPMAYYRALRQSGYEEAEALSLVRRETGRSAENKQREQAKLTKLPCTYLLYRLAIKGVMRKQFPSAGWETEWIRCDGKELHFNLKRCLYQDVCEQEDCPELCSVYCDNDDIAFRGLLPKIRFERSGTLAKGAPCCDFHLIKNQ